MAKPKAPQVPSTGDDGGAASVKNNAPAGSKPPVEPTNSGNAQVPPPKELQEQGEALNGLSWQKLQAELKKGGIDKAVVKIALDLEQAKPEADQRGTTLKFLTQALEA
ncbi:hypothetical protein D3C81_1163880 [compost metagenome]